MRLDVKNMLAGVHYQVVIRNVVHPQKLYTERKALDFVIRLCTGIDGVPFEVLLMKRNCGIVVMTGVIRPVNMVYNYDI